MQPRKDLTQLLKIFNITKQHTEYVSVLPLTYIIGQCEPRNTSICRLNQLAGLYLQRRMDTDVCEGQRLQGEYK